VDVRVLIGPEGRALEELYAAPRRPWLRLNFVSTVDGAVQGGDGRSGGINNEVDHRVFRTLRGLADAIVVGAGTARTEGYGPVETPIVVVSRSGTVPERLRGGRPGQVLLATGSEADGLAEARSVLGEDAVLVLGQEAPDLRRLRPALADRGFSELLCEGGPALAGDLLAQGQVDELCVTTVPLVVAGESLRMTAGPPVDVPLALHTLIEEDGTLLARWLTA
jgi:riboflavin biosynthesis pyrimidine reductase